MSGVQTVQAIVEILVAGIQGLAEGIGSGISEFAQALAYTTTGTGSDAVTTLSPYFILVIVFAGISLAKENGPSVSDGGMKKRFNCWESSLSLSAAKPVYRWNVQRLARCA